MEKKVKNVYFVDWSLQDDYSNTHQREFEWYTDAKTCAEIILETFGIEELQLLQVRERFIQIKENNE